MQQKSSKFPFLVQLARMLIASILVLAVLAITTGCATAGENLDWVDESTEFWLESSHGDIYAGETVTVIAQTENLLGKDAEVEWEAPGGEVETLSETIARVSFDEPGRYLVRGRLKVDGQPVKTDEVIIEVNRLPI